MRRYRSAARTGAAKVFLQRGDGSAGERRPQQLPESGPLRVASGLLSGRWEARNPATVTIGPPMKWVAVAYLAGKGRRKALVRQATDAAVLGRAPANQRGTP